MLVAARSDRVGIYNDELPSKKSEGPLTCCLARSHEILDLFYFH